jgi:hypothetical protein
MEIKMSAVAMKKPTNTTYVPIDIFVWNQTKTNANDRPANVLDKKPDDHEAKPLEELVNDFTESNFGKLSLKNLKKNGTTINYNTIPFYEEITLRELMSALAVQRPVSNRHIKRITEVLDLKKIQYVNVLKIKIKGKYYYYIIDGQHTAVLYGSLAKWGYFSDNGIAADNWLDVKVKCQVVEFHNFTFAREHFLGINGDDKLKLAMFDRWKNYVLSKRQDSPNEITNDKYEDAYAQQVILESYNIIPVHERDEENIDKPGAFSRVDLLKDLSEEEVHWFARIHQMNWDDRPVDSFEVLPMKNLRDKIKGSKSLDNPEVKDFIITLGNIIKNVSGTPAKFKNLTEATYKEWFKTAYPGEKVPASPPADASLALLLFIYYEHGGTFKNIAKMFMDDFIEEGYTIFHALDQDLQDMIAS